jgi:glutaminase
MAVTRVDQFAEMKEQVREMHRLLVGNGAIGICEQVRANTREITELTHTVTKLAQSVQAVTDHQTEHREWHAKPENMTIQQALARPGIKFIIVLAVVSLLVIALAVGIPEAGAWLKSLV